MHIPQLIEFARTKRGLGWLGVMDIVDIIDHLQISSRQAAVLKQTIQHEFGQLILSGEHGCDESAVSFACNQCIELLIANEAVLILDHNAGNATY